MNLKAKSRQLGGFAGLISLLSNRFHFQLGEASSLISAGASVVQTYAAWLAPSGKTVHFDCF